MLTKAEQLTRRMPQVHAPERFATLSFEQYAVTEEWVATAFLDNVVRLGTGAEKLNSEYPDFRTLPSATLSASERDEFLSRIDNHQLILPSKERYDHLQRQFHLPDHYGQVEQAVSVLCHPLFRKGSYETMGEACVQKIYTQLKNNNSVQIVVPTLPFKDQCAVTTRQPPGTVDLGERLFLMRLDLLARSLQSASGLSVSIQIVADGAVYADIFTQNSKEEVAKYFCACRDLIQSSNFRNIHIIDMEHVVAKETKFSEVRDQVRNTLLNLIKRDNESIQIVWQALLRGMLFNCQLPPPFDEYESFVSLARLTMGEIRTKYHNVYEVIFRAGLEYASFLLTMKKLSVLLRYFSSPGTIRATVHPKNGQLGLHTVGSEVAPYNGVTVVNLKEFQHDPRIANQKWYSCQRFYRLLSQENVTRVVDQNDRTFCYVQT